MQVRTKIILLGLMLWAIKFLVGGAIFSTGGEHGPEIGTWWISGIQSLSLAMSLSLALYLLYKNKKYRNVRTAWEAGITWYSLLLVLDLIVLVGLAGLELDLWFPLILLDSSVLIIPIAVGYLFTQDGKEQ